VDHPVLYCGDGDVIDGAIRSSFSGCWMGVLLTLSTLFPSSPAA